MFLGPFMTTTRILICNDTLLVREWMAMPYGPYRTLGSDQTLVWCRLVPLSRTQVVFKGHDQSPMAAAQRSDEQERVSPDSARRCRRAQTWREMLLPEQQ